MVLKRVGLVLGIIALVAVLLLASTAFLPVNLVVFYILGWVLTLAGINLRQTRLRNTVASDVVTVVDGIALFIFVLVGFRVLTTSNLIGTALAVVGIGAVAYSSSL